MLLEKNFFNVYTKFKLNFYRKIFSRFETREASLTAVETFCVEVISALDKPTINEFAKFVNISQANAAYKVQSLIEKGYIVKKQSQRDKREYQLYTTEKYERYSSVNHEYIHKVMERMEGRFSEEQIEMLNTMLDIMANELMPEIDM